MTGTFRRFKLSDAAKPRSLERFLGRCVRELADLTFKTSKHPTGSLREFGFGHLFLTNELREDRKDEKWLPALGTVLAGYEAWPVSGAEKRSHTCRELDLVIISF